MRKLDSIVRVGTGSTKSESKSSCLRRHEVIVHQIQCLLRNCGGCSLGGSRVGIGTVKQSQVRMALKTLSHQVNATVHRGVDGLKRVMLRPSPRNYWRERLRS